MRNLYARAFAAFALFTMLPFAGYSQVRRVEPCATTKVMEELFKKNPLLKAKMDLQEKQLQALIQKQKSSRKTSGTVYTIPVVVHIFHTGQAIGATDPNLNNQVPNPSPAQIQAAVDAANADFNFRQNTSRYVGGDSVGIRLCLSKTDPNGNPIPSGAITRHDGSLPAVWGNVAPANSQAAFKYLTYGMYRNGNATGDGVNESDLLSVVQWDPTRYYNIYMVTQIDSSAAGAGVKGFAYFPNGTSTDYAIMDPSSFAAPDVSTFTHEMGHALNLYHTFRGHAGQEEYQGTTCPDPETACDSDGDFCCDIPQHKSSFTDFCSSIGPDNAVNACAQATGAPASAAGTHGEFQNNFMNYGGCHNTFSPDQASRMRAVVGAGGLRAPMVTSTNLTNCGCTVVTPTTSSDMAVTKTVSASPYAIGQNLVFTVVASNNGPDNASGVTVNDLLPPGLTYVTSTASTGSYNPTTGVWNVNNLSVSATATLTVTATPTSTGTYQNCAAISATETDNTASNNNSCVSVNVPAPPTSIDLVVTKTVSSSPYAIGQNLTYTVVVTNNGPATASGVQVTDVLPNGLNYVSSVASTGSYNSGNGGWTVGNLAVSASATLTITVSPSASGTYQNCASATGTQTENAPSDNSSCVSITVPPPPSGDLSVTKTAGSGPYSLGQNLTYTITASNVGVVNGTGVVVTDVLPAGLTFVSSSASTGTYNSGNGQWTIGNLTAGASASLSIVVTPTAATTYNNCASISGTQTDNNSANNNSCFLITVINPSTDLSVTKTASASPYSVGQNLTYIINASNAGPASATSVVVTDVLPAGLTFVSSAPSVGLYNSSTGKWTIGNLTSGANASLSIVVTPTAAGTYNNCASINGTQTDNNTSDNSSCIVINVFNPSADLAINKTVSAAPYSTGQNLTYIITASNVGTVNGTGVVVTDILPAGLTFVGSVPSVGIYNSSNGQWTIGNLISGASASLSLVVTPTTSGTFDNCASITGTSPDNNTSNNNSCIAITVSGPPVASFSLSAASSCLSSVVTVTDNSSGPPTGYKWNFGSGATPATATTQGPHNITYSTSGIKTISVTVTNSGGSDVSSKNLTIYPVPSTPVITKGPKDTLHSSAASGNQWYDAGGPIAGANKRTLYPGVSGTYTVRVTDLNGCTSESLPYDYNNIAGIGYSKGSTTALKAYPNPFNQELVVNFGLNKKENVTVELIDYTGKVIITLIKNKSYTAGNYETSINASQYSLQQGIYLIRLTTAGEESSLIKVSYIR